MLFAASLEVVVGVGECIHFLIEHVQIGKECAVLLLALHEYGFNLIDVGKSRSFLYGVEGFVEHSHVSLVAVDHPDLLLVVEDDSLQLSLQQCGRVEVIELFIGVVVAVLLQIVQH